MKGIAESAGCHWAEPILLAECKFGTPGELAIGIALRHSERRWVSPQSALYCSKLLNLRIEAICTLSVLIAVLTVETRENVKENFGSIRA